MSKLYNSNDWFAAGKDHGYLGEPLEEAYKTAPGWQAKAFREGHAAGAELKRLRVTRCSAVVTEKKVQTTRQE